MTSTARKLLDEVLALPEDDQRWLVDRLLDRAPRDAEEIEKAWVDEAVERLERAERGEATLVPYEEVLANVQAALRDE